MTGTDRPFHRKLLSSNQSARIANPSRCSNNPPHQILSGAKKPLGKTVIRISIPWVVDVVSFLDKLDDLTPGMGSFDWVTIIYPAYNNLQSLISQSLYRDSLITCRTDANLLSDALQKVMNDLTVDMTTWVIEDLKAAKNRFRTILLAELATLPCFFVSRKPPYDTNALLDFGENLVPVEISAKVPEAVYDLQEAGKCLAFELATASAFHLFRALETVVRAYHRAVCSGVSEPKQRSLGVYIRSLEKAGSDSKVIAALTQLKDLHRNPIAHPEAVIDVGEAMNIAGLVRSATAAMAGKIPVPQATTSSIQ